MKNKNKWVKFRHRVARNILFALLYPIAKIKYGFTVEKFKEQGDRPYLILMNHQTAFDQFFVGMCVSGPVYYVATEDIFSLGFISRVIEYLVAPIPIKKSTSDVRAVMNCLRVAKEGGTIAIFPEGNRTFHGRTCSIKPAVAKLAKSLKMPVAILRIEGGFGTQPRWGRGMRKGKTRVFVSRVIEPEEYKSIPDEEFYRLLCNELSADESKTGGTFQSKHLAEYLERVAYVCPDCGLSSFYTKKDLISCSKCGLQVRYGADKSLTGVNKPFPYSSYADWYDAQVKFIHELDLSALGQQPVYCDDVELSEVIVYKKKKLLDKKAKLSLFADRYEIEHNGEKSLLSFNSVSAASVLGKNKLNIYFGETVWQIKADERFNPVKYMNFYYHYKNVKQGDTEYEFLGL